MSGTEEPRRVALVSGATEGIGAATALALARDGCDVVVTELGLARLADTVRAIEQAGGRALALQLDLRSQAGIEAAFAEAIAAFGRVDVLVNNAGVTLRRAAVDVSREDWDAIMSVMLAGTFFMSQQMGRHLIATKRPGVIVSLASTHGVVGLALRSAYGIAKGGIVQMTRMLAIEWAQHGIRVNAVAPGTVETPSRAASLGADPALRDMLLKRVPLGRFGTAEEVAAAVCYLASPDAAYITGQTILIDGGLTAA
jgi:NAD(P)-dependent dehydrogenase (short-subunit alcohol dehydrogenase family)